MDLERFWNRLRPRSTPTDEPRPRGWNLLDALRRAAIKADAELRERFKASNIDPKVVSEVSTAAIHAFLDAWYDELRQGDTVSLIGVVLDGRDLPVEELNTFVRALPATLLQRICDDPTPRASGLQALLAIENDRRTRKRAEYTLSRDPLDDKLLVTFRPPETFGEPIFIKLDEGFNVNLEESPLAPPAVGVIPR